MIDYMATKGEQLWDYLYSRDAARALRLLGKNGRDGKVYVLGSGNARPLAEYIKIIRDIVAPEQDIALEKSFKESLLCWQK